jgi:predicted ferric reductase
MGLWAGLLLALLVPLVLAATSPLLAWREPVYIISGFAGIIALALLVMQPLLAIGALPGIALGHGRRVHRLIGASLVGAVIVHVAGLWITSPPDVVDALTFSSPTRFSNWGVISMWAVFAAGTMALVRRRLRLPPRTWSAFHLCLAMIIVPTAILHTLLIDGTMETVSKIVLCAVTAAALCLTVYRVARRGRRT